MRREPTAWRCADSAPPLWPRPLVTADAAVQELKLDTLERLPAACRLYEALGFARCGAYCENPFPDAVYMHLVVLESK